VARDGTLSEPNGPILLSTAGVPGNAHPQGIAVVAGTGHHHRGDEGDHGHHDEGAHVLDSILRAHGAAGSSSATNFATVPDAVLTDLVNALMHLSHESGSGS
jgi:hypothetical protein